MKPTQIERMVSAFLLTATMALSGCSLIYPTPPVKNFEPLEHNTLVRFDRVDDDVYRSSQPNTGQLKTLVETYHFKTVLKLNTGAEPTRSDVKLLHYPLYGPITPSAEKIQTILASIYGAEKPVLIHCSQGEDRTGLIVALYNVCQGMTPENAYKDMVAHGFHPYRGLWNAWVREVGWKQARLGTGKAVCPPKSKRNEQTAILGVP